MSTARLGALLAIAMSACKGAPPPAPPPAAPVATATRADAPAGSGARARKSASVDTMFGTTVPDPYRWLEDGSAPEVKAWAAAEDRTTRAWLAEQKDRDAIAERVKSLVYIDADSPPIRRGKREFFERRARDREKGVVMWSEKGGEPKALLDPLAIDPEGKTSLGVWVPNDDGTKVAFALKENNADEATLHLIDVATGARSTIDVIPGAKYATPSWTPDGRGYYYTWLPVDPQIPVSERPGYAEVRFHKLGADPKTDVVVREKTGDATTFVQAELSHDGRYLFLTVSRGWSENDLFVRTMDLASSPGSEGPGKKRGFVPIAAGQAHRYRVVAFKGRLYLATDDGAPRYRIFAIDPNKLAREQWKEIIPEDRQAVIVDHRVIGGRLALAYTVRATSALRVFELDGRAVRDVPLPVIGTASALVGRDDDDEAFFAFSSFTFPPEVRATSIKTGATRVHSKSEVPVDPSLYSVEQVEYPSKDGTPISMFIVHKKGLEKTGDHPTLLWGYGGFNVSITPTFRPGIYPWLDRGGVFAIANLRGGGEYGEAWHQAGKREKKQNVFDDFIAAAEHLIKARYTRPDKLAISGRSNGGLLVGAALTQRPDLFGAVLCGVPLLDMVRFHKFGSGKTWVPEYGNPDVQSDFAALHAYSPYHRLTPGTRYPALLMLSADHDDRVDPMHARKFIAALAEASAGGAPHLLRLEANSGHGGADLRKATVEQATDETLFLLATLNFHSRDERARPAGSDG